MVKSFYSHPRLTSPDSILKLANEFELDKRKHKVNAGIGVIKDEAGKVWVPQVVQDIASKTSLLPTNYLTAKGESEFLGDQEYVRGVIKLLYREYAADLLAKKQIVAVGSVGGTGALAVLAEGMKISGERGPVYLSDPTWPNHITIFQERRVKLKKIKHLRGSKFNFDAYVKKIKSAPKGSFFLFHGGLTHNPSGVNPSRDELLALIKLLKPHRVIIDMAYAGIEAGLDKDTEMIRLMYEHGIPTTIAFSFAKNCGLYNQRPGILITVEKNASKALATQRMLNSAARFQYSTPAAYGERIVAKLLSTQSNIKKWESELKQVSSMLKQRREKLAVSPALSFVTEQHGLYSLLGLSSAQIERLKSDFSIYMPANGRLNFGGVSLKQIEYLLDAVQAIS